MESDNPAALGVRKIGRWKGAYTYEIGRRYRIFYIVHTKDVNIAIEFLEATITSSS